MTIELFYYKYCLFTYHIVNIKQICFAYTVTCPFKFTYHIVNIKREGVEIDRLRSDVFTYHIVNIKLL